MTARVVPLLLAAVMTTAAACKGSPVPRRAQPDPTAGRSRLTVIYSGNMYGELLDCG